MSWYNTFNDIFWITVLGIFVGCIVKTKFDKITCCGNTCERTPRTINTNELPVPPGISRNTTTSEIELLPPGVAAGMDRYGINLNSSIDSPVRGRI